ncbi:MAG TPA: hypothetical protein VFI54_09690 [Solirubrobacteraceae bacterium]|nr:hypothetical protein [Solirubrobacteraceae bacterium]
MGADAVPTMLYVSYRGEQKGGDASPEPPQQNLDVIDQQGYVGQNVLQTALPPGIALDELRGICFGADGYLWVASAAKTTSLILRFQAHASGDGVHEYKDCVASTQLLDAVDHPFDIAFQPGTENWFVSNQDTNVVAGPFPAKPLQPPFPLATYLKQTYPNGTFWEGTLIASACEVPVKHAPTIQTVPTPQGLDGEFSKKTRHSVRGLAHDGRLLYVADEQAGQVKGYDMTGKLAWTFPGAGDGVSVSEPVHLLLAGAGLLVGSSGTEEVIHVTPAGAATTTATVLAQGVKGLSGLAVDAQGTLYAASRTDQQVYFVPGAIPPESGAGALPPPQPWGKKLDDEPEFIVPAPPQQPVSPIRR